MARAVAEQFLLVEAKSLLINEGTSIDFFSKLPFTVKSLLFWPDFKSLEQRDEIYETQQLLLILRTVSRSLYHLAECPVARKIWSMAVVPVNVNQIRFQASRATIKFMEHWEYVGDVWHDPGVDSDSAGCDMFPPPCLPSFTPLCPWLQELVITGGGHGNGRPDGEWPCVRNRNAPDAMEITFNWLPEVPHLRSLRILDMRVIRPYWLPQLVSLTISDIPYAKSLEVLEIRNCGGLVRVKFEDLIVQPKRNRTPLTVKIIDCADLEYFELSEPMTRDGKLDPFVQLHQLHFEKCPALSSLDATEHCPNLRSVSFRSCPGITDRSLDCLKSCFFLWQCHVSHCVCTTRDGLREFANHRRRAFRSTRRLTRKSDMMVLASRQLDVRFNGRRV